MTTKHESTRLQPRHYLPRHHSFTAIFVGFLFHNWEFISFRTAKWRSRRHLAELSDHQLRDIGRSRNDAKIEAGKPFWRD